MNEIIISIKPNFVEKILNGEKTVELRTRRANLEPGTKMWIYSTLPMGEICARATVDYVQTGSPEEMWKEYRNEIAINEEEFWEYVGEREAVSIIKISKVNPINKGISLKRIKEELNHFIPPQFFMRVKNNNPIKTLLYGSC